MDYSDEDGDITDIFVPMMGVHQLQNASLAIRACRILSRNGFDKVTPEAIKAGLSKVFWPGRMESIKDGRLIILDGAHNGRSADALARAINRHIKTPKRTIVVGMLKDKDTRRFIRALSTVSCKVIVTSVDSPRSMHPEKLAKKFKQRCFDCEVVKNPVDALIKAIDSTPDDGCVIVTGSLYLVASLRTALGRFNWNGI